MATAGSIAEARACLAKDAFDLVFMDLRLPDGNGIDLLKEVKQQAEAPYVVMMTGYASVESAVNCMRAGAFDYIIKPFSNSQIEIILKKAEEFNHILNVARFASQAEGTSEFKLLGNSPPMRNVMKLIEKVGPTQATVLIQGDSGTGKELIASGIHKASLRAQAPFIKVNCAAISETLMESEFFGHEKGAFTGATNRRAGRFELADGGTILLDEISEIKPALQAKLLRVLQEKEFERVGGNKTIKVDVRVISTTNRDLSQCVERGEFREDLYYRLNVFPITNPPLRERKDDIPLLAESFVKRFARKHGVKISGISSDSMKSLLGHKWPGNVRELQNTIERAVILSENGATLEPAALGLLEPLKVITDQAELKSQSSSPESSGKSLENSHNAIVLPMEEVEKQHILQALQSTKGNRTRTAELLKISLRTLRNKLRHYREAGETIPGLE